MWTGEENFILNQHFCFQQSGYLLEIFRSLSQDVPVSSFLEAAAPHRACLSTLQGAECRGWGCWDSECCWRRKCCWVAHADKFVVSLRSEDCSVESRQLENEIRSQFSNPVFQKSENEPAESFLRESKQRQRQRKGRKFDAKLLVASVILSLLPLLLRLKRTHLMELVEWKALSLSEGKVT